MSVVISRTWVGSEKITVLRAKKSGIDMYSLVEVITGLGVVEVVVCHDFSLSGSSLECLSLMLAFPWFTRQSGN